MNSIKLEQIAKMYDTSIERGDEVILQGHFHFGYWDETNPNASFAEAAERFTQIMIDKVDIQAGERFCDLGCGIGVPSMQLAQAKGCFIDGITISQSQQKRAQQLAAEAGLSDQTHFIVGNALEMPCEDASYHGGWFFESIYHMDHRKALQEASRILKPGATLLIAEFSTRPTTTEEFIAVSKEYFHCFFINEEDYPELLDTVGFDLIEIDDVTEFVMTPLIPKLKSDSEYIQPIKSDNKSDSRNNLRNMSENLKYIIVTAQKR